MAEASKDNAGNPVSPRTRVEAVMDALRERIASRSLMPGARASSAEARR